MVHLTGTKREHGDHYERMKRNLLAFEDRWDVLRESTERLHNTDEWPLLD